MVTRLSTSIISAVLFAALVGCGNDSENGQLSSGEEGFKSVTIATDCEEVKSDSGLSVRLVLQVSGTKYGTKIVGWRRSAGEMEPILGTNNERDLYTSIKVLSTAGVCKKPTTLVAKDLQTIVKNSLRDDYFEWSDPSIKSLVVKLETFKPAGFFTQLKVAQSVPLVSVEGSLFVELEESFSEKIPGIGIVSLEL